MVTCFILPNVKYVNLLSNNTTLPPNAMNSPLILPSTRYMNWTLDSHFDLPEGNIPKCIQFLDLKKFQRECFRKKFTRINFSFEVNNVRRV